MQINQKNLLLEMNPNKKTMDLRQLVPRAQCERFTLRLSLSIKILIPLYKLFHTLFNTHGRLIFSDRK